MSILSATTRTGLAVELLREALSEADIRDLAFEHFRPVYDDYSAAMSRGELIRRLVEWCDRHECLAQLVRLVAERNPAKGHGAEARLAALPQSSFQAPIRASRLREFIAHPLPEVPGFVGRVAEIHALNHFWDDVPCGLFCLVALGGGGKTSIVAEFLRHLHADPLRQPDRLVVWSFYEAPDAQAFLDSARTHFSADHALTPASAAGSLYLTLQALENGERNLLVLDGLERIQRQPTRDGLAGDILDPTLSQLVRRLAAGLDNTKAIITSRLSLPRLQPWLNRTYWVRDVTSMTIDDACRLLADKGVTGTHSSLRRMVDAYGAHALTLDHLGGYLQMFKQGRPEVAYRLPEPKLDTADPQEYRLARVLGAYESALDDQELALLSRLCVFRSSQTVSELFEIFSDQRLPSADRIVGPLRGLAEQDYERIVRRLAQLHLVLEASTGRWTAHPAVRDYFQRRFADAHAVEDAARRHFAKLVGPTGGDAPISEAMLDALEELIYHTLRLGRTDDARDIYVNQIGGVEQLGWRLGQYGRCVRILEEFPRCPDTGGLIWCYRALGDLDAASRLVAPDDLWWLGMIGCLRGRLAEVADLLCDSHDDPILTICEVLTGRSDSDVLRHAPAWLGLPISLGDAWLSAGKVEEAAGAIRNAPQAEQTGSWNDEETRADLTLAEIARGQGELDRARAVLDKASQWIIKSGSQEHLCRLHLGETRLAIDNGQLRDAATMLRQGLLIAQQCGFGLMHIDLLIESARLALAEGRFDSAASAALSALNGIDHDGYVQSESDINPDNLVLLGALHPLCQYISGTERARACYRQARKGLL